jgi:Cu-Zn family superoxide dismutase
MKTVPLAAAIALALTVAACATGKTDTTPSAPSAAAASKATVTLQPTKGSGVHGTATFTQHGDNLTVNARIAGLTPGAEHGFHLHEKGNCSSGDGMSAGGHFNPMSKPHGDARSGPEHHAGDMPTLKADANGIANVTFDVPGLAVGSGAADIVGKGVIVHRDADDYKSQPAGNAGPRLACGVVQRG